jgi:hypothetical protein
MRRRSAGDPSGFEHALNVWCGFGRTREAAREHVAEHMQRFYKLPFEPLERYSPYGTPQDVAEILSSYVGAGCSAFVVIPCASDDESAIAGGRRSSHVAELIRTRTCGTSADYAIRVTPASLAWDP